MGQFISYTHLMESVPPSKVIIITAILFFLEGVCGYIISPVLLLLFMNTDTLIISALVLNVFSLLLMIYLPPSEGIRFWLTHGKYELAITDAIRVLEYNNTDKGGQERAIEMINQFRD